MGIQGPDSLPISVGTRSRQLSQTFWSADHTDLGPKFSSIGDHDLLRCVHLTKNLPEPHLGSVSGISCQHEDTITSQTVRITAIWRSKSTQTPDGNSLIGRSIRGDEPDPTNIAGPVDPLPYSAGARNAFFEENDAATLLRTRRREFDPPTLTCPQGGRLVVEEDEIRDLPFRKRMGVHLRISGRLRPEPRRQQGAVVRRRTRRPFSGVKMPATRGKWSPPSATTSTPTSGSPATAVSACIPMPLERGQSRYTSVSRPEAIT